MLTKQEEDFVRYWEINRLKKRKLMRQFSIGLPIGVLIVALLFINLLSGWYERADMILRTHSSIIIVVLIACVGISVFIMFFWSNHKWEQNEQRYQEIKYRLEKASIEDATKTNII